MANNPRVAKYAPVVLYRTLGPTLPEGMAAAAIYWAFAHQFVQVFKGHTGQLVAGVVISLLGVLMIGLSNLV